MNKKTRMKHFERGTKRKSPSEVTEKYAKDPL